MTIQIFKSTSKSTINLLTNKHINIKTHQNDYVLITIIKNPFDINIEKLLTNNYIPFKIIK